MGHWLDLEFRPQAWELLSTSAALVFLGVLRSQHNRRLGQKLTWGFSQGHRYSLTEFRLKFHTLGVIGVDGY